MAQDCDQPDYSKLVQALCSEANVSLITVPASKTLGEWCGLCKLDAEGLARKVVGCSFVVIKVRAAWIRVQRAPRGGSRVSARATAPSFWAVGVARLACACVICCSASASVLRSPRSRRDHARPAGLRGGVRGPGRCPGVPEEQVERCLRRAVLTTDASCSCSHRAVYVSTRLVPCLPAIDAPQVTGSAATAVTNTSAVFLAACVAAPQAASVPLPLRARARRAYEGMYVAVSICSGSSLMSTSKRSCTLFSVSLSVAEAQKVMAKPLVPKRPARPTRCRYESAPSGMS